jgi:6-phosphofructokinase
MWCLQADGFNTAVQTAIDAVDKIRDTASAHLGKKLKTPNHRWH